jgi:hypothetical protein
MELMPDCRAELVQAWDAIIDSPVPSLYKTLDCQWPGSKFILTTRSKASWLESMDWMLTHGKAIWWWDLKTYNYARDSFGTTRFDPQTLSAFFDRFHEDVEGYFHNRSEDLLEINLDVPGDASLARVATFLGCEDCTTTLYSPKGTRVHASKVRRLSYSIYRRCVTKPTLDTFATKQLRRLHNTVKKKKPSRS